MTLLKEGLIVVLGVLVPALVGSFVAFKLTPPRFRQACRADADPVWAIAGGAFGLLLGFMVVTLWQDLVAADDTVQAEATDLVNLFELAGGLPEGARVPARAAIVDYTRLLVDDEWEKLGRHERSPLAENAVKRLWSGYLALEPSLGRTNDSYAESLRRMQDLQGARNRRLDAAESVVPSPLWIVLIGGVAIMIVLMWFTGAEHLGSELVMTAVLAISLASILFLVRVFNNPFQGSVRADQDPMVNALRYFEER